ncbi:MAG TPA: M20 family metallopeptidase [Acidimicrobiia bacterium]|nr:M20 family metallopeptidase [Acidimicrobiia bacterium]
MPTHHSSEASGLDRAGLIEFTRRLVRIPSVNRPGELEAEAARAVVDLAESYGWRPVVEEVEPGRPNVIIRLRGDRPGKTLLFEGHTDVVTEGDLAEWTHHPFAADMTDGRIYGRGSADMKGGIAAMMYAARSVELSGRLHGEIVLAILCDEEEMMIGVSDFVSKGHAEDVDGAIICEPEAGEICNVQKGAMRIRVDLGGRMAHGAMPHQGRNPIVAASRLIEAVADLEDELQELHGEHERLGLPYITPTHITAGTLPQLNVIPATALLTLDIRTIPGMDHDDLSERLSKLAGQMAAETGVELELVNLVDRCPTETPEDDPIVSAVSVAHTKVTGSNPVYGGVPGTTDGTILWRDAGIPVVIYGPGGKWIAHQADEYVEIEDLVTHAEVYIEAAATFLAS